METNGNLIRKTFVGMMLINSISMLFGILCSMIDTIITGRFLGTDAVAAAGLCQPVILGLNALAMLFGPGLGVVCSGFIGKAMKDRVNQVFSVTMAAVVVVFAVVSVLLFAAAPAIANALGGGAGGAIVGMTADYLRGYALGVLPTQLSMTMAGLMMLDNDKLTAMVQMLAVLLCDVAFDLLNVLVFHGGMWGMALATSLSQVVGLLVILTHFLRKNRILHFTLHNLKLHDLREVMHNGIPNLLTLGGQMVRSLSFNFILLTMIGSGAVAALTVGNTAFSFVASILMGAGISTSTLSSLLYGEEDRDGLVNVLRASLRSAVSAFAVFTVLLVVFAEPVARLFLESGSGEELRQSARFIRFITIQTLLATPSYSLTGAYLGVKKLRLNCVIAVLRDCVIPVVCAWLMARMFGLGGFEMSMIVSMVLLLAFCVAVPWVKNRRFPASLGDMLMLPDSFGPAAGEVYAASISTMEDVMAASQEIQRFCRAQGATPKLSNLASLFVEEIAKNTVTHGFGTGRRGSIDLRLILREDKKVIRFRDNARPFNPVEWLEKNHPDDPTSCIGIRMIVAMAQDVNYVSAVGWNNLMITL